MLKSLDVSRPGRGLVAQSTLVLVLGLEMIFFGTLVMSYFYLRGGGSDIPFTHPGPTDLLIGTLNALVFLSSALTAWSTEVAARKDQFNKVKQLLRLTLAMGLLFILVQIFEFKHLGLKIDVSIFGAVFFALITFHAVHVIAGMGILALNYYRARLGDFTSRRHVAITIGTLFWFFVIAVWLVLFTVLYLI